MAEKTAKLRERVRSFLLSARDVFKANSSLQKYGAGLETCLERLGRHEMVLMILGEVTKGKSELVNALIGDKLLPTNPRPTTLVPHYLRWGPELKIWVEDGAGKKRNLSRKELGEFSDVEAGEGEGVRVVIEHPAKFLQGGLVVVDTPGVNDINMQKEELLYEDLPAADAAIMVFDSRYVLTKTEATFLHDNLPETCRDRLLLVLSKIDRLDEAERAEVADWTREGLDKISLRAPFFPVSSRDALDEEKGDGGVVRLKEAIGELLGRGGGGFVLDNLLLRAGVSVGEAQSSLDLRVRALESGGKEAAARREKLDNEMGVRRGEAEEVIDRFRGELGDGRDALISSMKLFAMDFRKAIPESIEGVEAEDIKRHLPFFIRDTFRDWLHEELPKTEKRIHEAAKLAAENLTDGVRGLRRAAGLEDEGGSGTGAEQGAQGVGVKLALSTGVTGYDIGVAVLSVMGGITLFINFLAGGMLTAAAAAAAVQFRRERDAEVLSEAKKQAPKAVEDTWKRLEETLTEHFVAYEKKVCDELHGLFESEVDRLKSALDEAVEVAQKTGKELDTVRSECVSGLKKLNELTQELTDIRGLIAKETVGNVNKEKSE